MGQCHRRATLYVTRNRASSFTQALEDRRHRTREPVNLREYFSIDHPHRIHEFASISRCAKSSRIKFREKLTNVTNLTKSCNKNKKQKGDRVSCSKDEEA